MTDITKESSDNLRKSAEAKARLFTLGIDENIESLSTEQTKNILHDLRVHLTELEMQNEELRTTQTELNISRFRYFDLYDLAPMGYMTISEKGIIKECNLTACTLLGFNRNEITTIPISSLIITSDQDIYYLNRKQLYETLEPNSFDLQMRSKNGTTLWVEFLVSISKSENDEMLCRVAFYDISKRKQSEENLNQYKHVVSSSTDMIAFIDRRYNFIVVNEAYSDAFNLTPVNFIGKTVANVLGEELFNNVIKPLIDRCLSGEEIKQENWHDYPAYGQLYVEAAHYPYRNQDNEIMGCVVTVRNITAQKKAQNALLESEEQFRQLFENMNSGVAIYDAVDDGNDFRFKNINSAAEKIDNITKGKIIGNTITKVFPSAKELGFLDVFTRVWKTGVSEHFPISFYQDKRVSGWRDNYIYKLSSGQIVAIYDDITEQKQAAVALKNSEERFRSLLDTIPMVSIQGYALDGTTQYWNMASEHLYGYSAQEAIGRNLVDLIIPPEMRGDIVNAMHQMGETRQPIPESELMLKRKDGSHVAVFSSHAIVQVPGYPPELFCVDIDITERKQAEEKLRESEQKFNNMILNSPDMVLLTDNNGRITYISPQAEEVIGHKEEKFKGTGFFEEYVHPDDFEIVFTNFNKVMQGEDLIDFEYRFYDGNGQIQWLNHTARPIKQDGKIISIQSNVRNITKDKDAEIKAIDLQNQLNHKSKIDMLGQLAGGVAHDFNNILSGIMSASQLISMKENLSEKGKEYNDMIQSAAENGARLSNKLLTFSRKNNFQIESVNIESMIIDTIKILTTMLDKNISINFSPNGKMYPALLDFTSIQNAILNICINSSHAMAEGGKIAISLDVVNLGEKECENSSYNISPGDYNKLVIEDTGHGIAKDVLDQIFDPFFTTKEEGKGTGLGLAAVNRTIIELKGEIKVSSSPEKGTEMTLYIPSSENIVEEQRVEAAIANGSGTILLVDDEEINRLMGGDILESLGYNVILATNGKEAIDSFQLHANQISAVILDMSMPIMNGEIAFRKIKEIDKTCPVLLCSGYSKSEKVQKLLDEGLDGIIPKPFRISEISQTLFECLKPRKLSE